MNICFYTDPEVTKEQFPFAEDNVYVNLDYLVRSITNPIQVVRHLRGWFEAMKSAEPIKFMTAQAYMVVDCRPNAVMVFMFIYDFLKELSIPLGVWLERDNQPGIYIDINSYSLAEAKDFAQTF